MRADAVAALTRTSLLIATDVLPGAPANAIVDGLLRTTVRIVADELNVSSPSGQTTVVTLAAQLSMMGIGLALDVPDVPVLTPQPPLRLSRLKAALIEYVSDLIPRVAKIERAPDLTVFIGSTPGDGSAPFVRASGDDWRARVASEPASSVRPWVGEWPFGAVAAAAATSAEGFRAAIATICKRSGLDLPRDAAYRIVPGRMVDVDLAILPNEHVDVALSDVDFVSGGAITNAALYVLLRTPSVSGSLRVIEPDAIEVSNLNRYALARRSDVDGPKTDALRRFATDALHISGVDRLFEESPDPAIGDLAPTVVVGVDHIPSRWAAQRRAPGRVIVGATSHFFVMTSAHDPHQACAGCAHIRDDSNAGPIPTISFVSLWAGLLQARQLIVRRNSDSAEADMTSCWPTGLDGPHGLHRTRLAPQRECPVGCEASRSPTA